MTLLAGATSGCLERRRPLEILPLVWTEIPPPSGTLPEGVQLMAGNDDSLPLRAWAVRVEPDAAGVRVSVARSSEPDGRSRPTDLAADLGACILINGGFYWIDDGDRARHIGLLVRDGETVENPLNGVLWRQVRYPVARATLGADSSGRPTVGWVGGSPDGLVSWSAPFDNMLGRPALPPNRDQATPWQPVWALSAGPALIQDGRPRVTREEEAFFDAHMPLVHPRSAAGVTSDGTLLLVIVDGRQAGSTGVFLDELALILRDLGAVRALNLDGGGSTALVVNGRLVNRPAGSTNEREIASALTITCS